MEKRRGIFAQKFFLHIMHNFAQRRLYKIQTIEITRKISRHIFAQDVFLHKTCKLLKLQRNDFAQALPLKGDKKRCIISCTRFFPYPWGPCRMEEILSE